MSITSYDIDKFDGKNDFGLWKAKIEALLGQQKAIKAIRDPSKLPTTLTEEELETMELAARGIL